MNRHLEELFKKTPSLENSAAIAGTIAVDASDKSVQANIEDHQHLSDKELRELILLSKSDDRLSECKEGICWARYSELVESCDLLKLSGQADTQEEEYKRAAGTGVKQKTSSPNLVLEFEELAPFFQRLFTKDEQKIIIQLAPGVKNLLWVAFLEKLGKPLTLEVKGQEMILWEIDPRQALRFEAIKKTEAQFNNILVFQPEDSNDPN